MTTVNVSRYVPPRRWIHYDKAAILEQLVEAKTASGVLRQLPYLPQWIETMHQEQLRLEAAGTSRIEGAEFTPQEENEALAPDSKNSTELTYSQRQLRAAEAAYKWIDSQPPDHPVNREFVLEVHRRIVTGCEDDHCEPGALRGFEHNVTFGSPRCRGAEGGDGCRDAFDALCNAIGGEFREHDGIIQAMASHYHIGAMHPFGDGNGRTARALEAFMLRKAGGVNDRVMVSLSNYYYNHKEEYLGALFESRQVGHDLTPFLRFALPAVAERCNVVAGQILLNHKRVLFREFARSLFGQLRSPRRRVLAERQLQMLETLLDSPSIEPGDFFRRTLAHYQNLKHPDRAQVRDLIGLFDLRAVVFHDNHISINMEWPQQFSRSELLDWYEHMPSAISANHPAMPELSRLLGRRS
jgi:Fic family protein